MKKGPLNIIALSTICYLLSTAVLLGGCQDRTLYKDTELLMGTFVEVSSPDRKAAGIVFAEIKRIEELLSKYKPESEISQLNRAGKLKVSPETFFILEKAKVFWQASGGAFDITVSPLVDLWGFTDKKNSVPSEEEVKSALKLVGSDKIIFNKADNVIEFGVYGMKVDLGGIAKGYAVDCAVKKLKELGIESCLINAGGQVYCLGDKFGRPWNVAVRNPRNNNEIVASLQITDMAVATSGDYEQYFMHGNKRYSHILNPKTGYPADTNVISATVIAPEGASADALATAALVLGKEKTGALTKQFPGVKIKVIEEKDVLYNQQEG